MGTKHTCVSGRSRLQRWLIPICAIAVLLQSMLAVRPVSAAADDPAAIRAAIEQALAERSISLFPGNAVPSHAIAQDGDWALVAVSLSNGQIGIDEPNGGFLALAHYDPNGWKAALQSTDLFVHWLPSVPATILSEEAKRFLQPSQLGVAAIRAEPALSLPYGVGETWLFSGGPHGGAVRPAVDFAKNAGQVRAAADGVAIIAPNCPNQVTLDHGAGWQTVYYHLINISVPNGVSVHRGDVIGTASTAVGCGGRATGEHVHFWRKFNGVDQPIDGATIGGWVVHNGAEEYAGCLSRSDEQICAGAWLYNDGQVTDSKQPGDGAPTEPIRQAFIDAYNRAGGSANIAEITSLVHTWGKETVDGDVALTQNFRESAAWGGGIGSIIYNPGDGKAYVLHGSIEDVYTGADGPLGAWVGYPTSDETTIDDPAYYDFEQGGAIAFFERGFIAWPRGGAGFEMHTYYPRIDTPVVAVTLLNFPRVRFDITTHFERAPGYPDTTDPIDINLVWAISGVQQTTAMQVADLHTARVSIEANVHQPIMFAIELTNFSHNTTKRGSYPVAYAADHTTTRTMAARYRLGDPPAQHGEYWNRWDLNIAALAAAHNLPPALLKALIAHESGGLGTRGGDPTRAYLYEPMLDAAIQSKLSESWAQLWTLPNNPPPTELRPCAAVIPGGYDLPAGTTVFAMINTWYVCTNRWSQPQTNFVAQYRIAASYGLTQFVYRWHWDKLNGAAPESLYDPQLSLRLMAQKIDTDRNHLNPALTANSTNVADWAAVLTQYNGSSTYPPRVYAWYNGQGVAPVQPVVAVVYDAEATTLPALVSASASMPITTLRATDPNAAPSQVVAQITADIIGEGKRRLITLEQVIALNGEMTAVARIHKSTAPDSPQLYATPIITSVYGIGNVEVVKPAALRRPLLLVQVPVGPHTLITRIFTVRDGKLRELAPDVSNAVLPGFLSSSVGVQIGSDGTVFATVEGDPGHSVTTVYRLTSRGYIRDRVVDLGPDDTTFAVSDNEGRGDHSDQLRLVNRAIGATTLIGNTGATDIEGIAFAQGSNLLYATSGNRLGTLSLITGVFNPLMAPFGKGNGALGAMTFRNVNSLAFDPATHKLYGVRHRTHAQEQDLLFQIDPATGRYIPNAFGLGVDYVAIAGPSVPEDISAIAFDPASGQLYGVSGDNTNGGMLVVIDKVSGVAQTVGPIAVSDVEGLAFLDDGGLYLNTGDRDAGSEGKLYRVDTMTGFATLVAPFIGGRDYEGIAGHVKASG